MGWFRLLLNVLVSQVVEHVPVLVGEGDALDLGELARDILVPVREVLKIAAWGRLDGLAIDFDGHGCSSRLCSAGYGRRVTQYPSLGVDSNFLIL
jgi:hypothetical protein